MAKKNQQEFVAHITPREEDFQWYPTSSSKAGLVDYAPVRGCMVIKPMATPSGRTSKSPWMSASKATGHENVYFRCSSPSLLLRRPSMWRGFAPEVAPRAAASP